MVISMSQSDLRAIPAFGCPMIMHWKIYILLLDDLEEPGWNLHSNSSGHKRGRGQFMDSVLEMGHR